MEANFEQLAILKIKPRLRLTIQHLAADSKSTMERVVKDLEDAFSEAARHCYAPSGRFVSRIDLDSGIVKTSRLYEVVSRLKNPERELHVSDAEKAVPGTRTGQTIMVPVHPVLPEILTSSPGPRRAAQFQQDSLNAIFRYLTRKMRKN